MRAVMSVAEGNEQAKFRGDLHSIGLTEIFETLGARHQYGWLTLQNEDQEVILYFQGDLVGLATPPERKFFYIPAKLYHSGKLSEVEFQTIMSSEDPFKDLEERVAEDTLSKLLDTIYYDEICSLFSWGSGHFEFIDQHSISEEEQPAIVSKLFDAEGILMEAARRLDECKEIFRILPSNDEILLHSSKVNPAEVPPVNDPVGNILHLAQYRTVEETIHCSYLSEFDAPKILVSLYQEEMLMIIPDKQLEERARALKNNGELEESEKFYRLLYKRNPQSIEFCEALVQFYEGTGDETCLVDLYREIIDTLLASQEQDDFLLAASYLKKYSDLQYDTPEGIDARMRLLDMIVDYKLDAKAIEYDPIADGKWLFSILRRKKDDERAREVLQVLLSLTPYDKALRSELINIHLDLDDLESAVEQYEAMAKIYERDNNFEELQSTYKKILRLMPSRKDILNKLEKVEARKGRGKYMLLKILVVLAILGGGAWYYLNERDSNTFEGQIKILKGQAMVALKNGNFKLYDDILAEIALMLKEKGGDFGEDNFLEDLDKKRQEFVNKATQDIKDKRKVAQELVKAGNPSDAKNTLEEAITQTNIKNLNQALFLDISRELKDIKKTLDLFSERLDRAKTLLDEDRLQDAVLIYKELAINTKYKEMKEAQDILLPIRFDIQPKEAKIIINGKEVQPVRDNIYMCSPRFEEIQIKRPGYVSLSFYNAFYKFIIDRNKETKTKEGRTLFPLQDALVKEALAKDKLWYMALNGVIEAAPCVINDNLLSIACRDDSVYGVTNLKSRKPKKWKKTPGLLSSFKSTPAVDGDIVYVGGNNGIFYALDTSQKGRILAQYQIRSNPLIESSPQISKREGVVVFTADDGIVYALPLIKEKTDSWVPKWRRNLQLNRQTSSALTIFGPYVLTTCKDGNVYALSVDSGSPKWRWKIGSTEACAPVAYKKGRIYVGGSDKRGDILYAAKLTSKRFDSVVWTLPIKGRIFKGPYVDDEGIYFGTSQGHLYAVGHNGQVIWSKEMGSAFHGSVAKNSKGILYAASKDGTLYSINHQNGNIQWKYQMPKEIRSSPLLLNGMVFVGASKFLYALIDN